MHSSRYRVPSPPYLASDPCALAGISQHNVSLQFQKMRTSLKRQYKLNPLPLNIGPKDFLELAKIDYSRRYPSAKRPSPKHLFAYCIMYLVINPDKTMRVEFKFPQDIPLMMKFLHKNPKGAKPGEAIRNMDIREITNIKIPPYDNKYYFDFGSYVLDLTTDEYWATNLWTRKVCPDLRYYRSLNRKREYQAIGLRFAQSYTRTFMLGHVNLRTGKIKSSPGITKLIKHGWIPTISLLPQPYGEMVRIIESTNDMSKVNEFAVDTFNKNVLENILIRWQEASIVDKRKDILTTAIEAYKAGNYISAIYVMLPQVEGLTNEHIRRRHQSPEPSLIDRFKQFGEIIKGESFNTELTRHLTDILVFNLKDAFYKTWFPFRRSGRQLQPSSISPQRHVTLHGEVNPKYFTQYNCLKLICILDAIILLSLTKKELLPSNKAS